MTDWPMRIAVRSLAGCPGNSGASEAKDRHRCTVRGSIADRRGQPRSATRTERAIEWGGAGPSRKAIGKRAFVHLCDQMLVQSF